MIHLIRAVTKELYEKEGEDVQSAVAMRMNELATAIGGEELKGADGFERTPCEYQE
jgi:hypothetical protein